MSSNISPRRFLPKCRKTLAARANYLTHAPNVTHRPTHRRALTAVVALTTILCFSPSNCAQANPEIINPPIGPYTNPKPQDFSASTSFSTTDRVVFTPYFYWYDAYTSAHIIDSDGSDALTDHPPTLTDFSYKSVEWHKTQLLDMIDAGIDVLLPVYWGEPSQRRLGQPISAQPWSFSGIPPLVQARDQLLAEGKKPPAIGMFYDTSTLQYNAAGRRIDLTTPYGQQWFYESIRDFFSLVPAKHWAMIDGHPVIFLYSSAFAENHDQTCIDFLRTAFASDFGGRKPFVVREISWHVQADDVYAWGGALGLKNPGLASLGPGYDHSAVPGREPLIVDRENGAFFERNWIKFLRRPSPRVMIETWNEYHEGTDIAASREYGRQYIELNRKYVNMFKAGLRPPRPRGPYSDFKAVYVILKQTNAEHGLVQFDHADGVTAPDNIDNSDCRVMVKTQHAGRYIYFRIDESFKWADTMLVEVNVEYYDAGSGSFRIEFDGSDTNAPFQGAYTASSSIVTLKNSWRWLNATFKLTGARFLNSQNGGADFRIAINADTFAVRKVTVARQGLPEEAGAVLHGLQQDFAQPASSWITVDAPPGTFHQTNNMLVAKTAPSGFPRLILALPNPNLDVSEILARLRVVHFADQNRSLGGIGFALRTNTNTGLILELHSGQSSQRMLAWKNTQTSTGPTADYPWRTNLWFWLRIRHQTNSVTLHPDLFARIWLADGETPEPTAWTAWWDYYPQFPHQKGWPGIIAGIDSSAAIECDFFLAKGDELPEITVRLPPLKSARPEFTTIACSPSAGIQLILTGTPLSDYVLETTTDFAKWSPVALATDKSGRASFADKTAWPLPYRFYRARSLE